MLSNTCAFPAMISQNVFCLYKAYQTRLNFQNKLWFKDFTVIFVFFVFMEIPVWPRWINLMMHDGQAKNVASLFVKLLTYSDQVYTQFWKALYYARVQPEMK